jgi:hypothetical protein
LVSLLSRELQRQVLQAVEVLKSQDLETLEHFTGFIQTP